MLFCRPLIFFQFHFYEKIISEISSECQTVWIQNRLFVGPDLGPNCLQRLSSDDTSRQRVNIHTGLYQDILGKGFCVKLGMKILKRSEIDEKTCSIILSPQKHMLWMPIGRFFNEHHIKLATLNDFSAYIA